MNGTLRWVEKSLHLRCMSESTTATPALARACQKSLARAGESKIAAVNNLDVVVGKSDGAEGERGT